MRIQMLVVLSWVLVLPAVAQDDAREPFFLPTPEGWRTETISMPPAFAQELRHHGLGTLRFSPGMFDPDRDDFWSYLMIWWLPGDTNLSATALEEDLRIYYRGLVGAVAPGAGFDPESVTIDADLEAEGSQQFRGRITTLDAFATGKAVELTVRIAGVMCDEKHLSLIFSISPQHEEHEIWGDLETIRSGFRCGSRPAQ